jgi:hypothetical protein
MIIDASTAAKDIVATRIRHLIGVVDKRHHGTLISAILYLGAEGCRVGV